MSGRGNKKELPKVDRSSKVEAWPEGYMGAKLQKLDLQFDSDCGQFEKKSEIFKGITIHVNGYTQPPADELRRLIGLHGGRYQPYFRRGTGCFIIANNLSQAKSKDWLKFAVRADWIVDSIAAGRRLPVAPYYLEQKQMIATTSNIDVSNAFDNISSAGKSGYLTTSASVSSLRSVSVNSTIPEKRTASIDDLVIGKRLKTESDDVAGSVPRVPKLPASSKPVEPKTASDVGFVKNFFEKSRLSFIANMRVKMREYLKDLKENVDHNFDGRSELQRMVEDGSYVLNGKIYLHIDMDCFFASVTARNKPELKDKPIAVCSTQKARRKDPQSNIDLTDYRQWNWHDASTAEVSCCNYAARQFGVRASMLLGKAQTLCPNLIVLPYDFEGFEEVSKCLYDSVASLTLDIEALSVDELYADITDVVEDLGCHPDMIAKYLRKRIEQNSKCTASVGMGPNMLIARLATKKAKPNGFCFISPDEVEEFMADKKVSEIPGIGYSTDEKLQLIGITTCRDLKRCDEKILKEHVGANQAARLIELASGICRRTLKDPVSQKRKNISVEINYGMRFKSMDEVKRCLGELSDEVYKRMSDANLAAEGLRLKILIRSEGAGEPMKYLGCGECDALTKTEMFKIPITNVDTILKSVIYMLQKLSPVIEDIRGMGITLTKLTPVKSVSKVNKIEVFLKRSFNNQTKMEMSLTPEESVYCDQSSNAIEDKKITYNSTQEMFDAHDFQIYVYSSEDSDNDGIEILKPRTKPQNPMVPSRKPAKTKVKSKGKTTTTTKKISSVKSKQIDIRKVVQGGAVECGEGGIPASTEIAGTSGGQMTQYDLKWSERTFGPKKLLMITRLLKEWTESWPLVEEDIAMFTQMYKDVCLIDPRSCTVLMRSFYRFTERSSKWHPIRDRIRREVQRFVDAQLLSGRLKPP